jgi:hypothetical protein
MKTGIFVLAFLFGFVVADDYYGLVTVRDFCECDGCIRENSVNVTMSGGSESLFMAFESTDDAGKKKIEEYDNDEDGKKKIEGYDNDEDGEKVEEEGKKGKKDKKGKKGKKD